MGEGNLPKLVHISFVHLAGRLGYLSIWILRSYSHSAKTPKAPKMVPKMRNKYLKWQYNKSSWLKINKKERTHSRGWAQHTNSSSCRKRCEQSSEVERWLEQTGFYIISTRLSLKGPPVTLSRKEFYRVGGTIEKDQFHIPSSCSSDNAGMQRGPSSYNLNGYVRSCRSSWSFRCTGPSLFRALWVKPNNFNWARLLIGNQRRCRKCDSSIRVIKYCQLHYA